MTVQTASGTSAKAEIRASWVPMLIIALAQIQMSFNVSALPVSIGGIVEEFNTSPSTVSSALVMYSLAVAALVMLGAKLGQRFGAVGHSPRRGHHGVGMPMMVLATGTSMLIAAQAVAGAGAASLVPALVVMIATTTRASSSRRHRLSPVFEAIAGAIAF